MENHEIKKDKLNDITKETFKQAVYLSYRDGITSVAPLGCSGDTVIIHGSKNEKTNRCSQVSIRNYCGNAELLITDKDGGFLFYGRFDINLGVGFVVQQYWDIFKKVKNKILYPTPERADFSKIKIPEGINHTEGFEMIRLYHREFIKNKSIF